MLKTVLGTVAAAALLAAPTFAQDTYETANAGDIEEALVGNTFNGDMGGGGYASFFAEGGTYYDESGSGTYEITDDGVCYPDTDFGCYEAVIDGVYLEWIKDGEPAGSGEIIEGDFLNLVSSE